MKNKLLIIILLAALSFIGNVLNVTLYNSISFIFGSIFALLALRIFDMRWAILVGFIGAIYTVHAWGHPYALIVFTAEIVCVGFLLRRIDNLALADMLFWAVLGSVLVLIFYAGALGLPADAALYIALKQGVNGVFNAVIAGLLLVLFRPALPSLSIENQSISIQSLMFKVLAFVGIFTSALLIVSESRSEYKKIVTQLESVFVTIATWAEHEADEHPSEVPFSRSGMGAISNVLTMSRMEYDPERDLSIALIEPDGRVIVMAGDPQSIATGGTTENVTATVVRWGPATEMAEMLRSRQSRYVYTYEIETGAGQRQLVVELSAAPIIDLLEQDGREDLVLLAMIMLIVLGMSYYLTEWLVRPLKDLSDASATLAKEIVDGRDISGFKVYDVHELNSLSTSLSTMALSLSKSFKDQEALANTLECRVKERTAQLDLMSRVAQQTTDSVIVTDAKGQTTWVNKSFERLTGYSLDDMRGQTPGRILQKVRPPQETIEHMKASIARADTFHVELLNHTRDGKPYWVEIRSSPLLESDGRHTGFIAIQSDVTERKRLTETLQGSLERLQLATDVAELGVWTFHQETKSLDWDELNFALHGLDPMSGTDLMKAWLAGIVDEDRQQAAEIFRSDFRGNDATHLYEYRFLHPAKGERTMLVSVRQQATKNDGPVITGATRDVTAERRAQQEIEEAARHTRAILDNVIDAVIAINADGLITSFNKSAEQMFGYSTHEILRCDVVVLMTGKHATAHKSYLDNFISTNRRKIMGQLTEFDARRKNGTTFPILLAVSEVKTSNKHFFIGIIRDATVERQLQEQLRQSQKLEAVGQLTGGISHDFNNLLTVILGSAETLVDSLESDPQHRRHAEMILNAAERGAQLTNRLLSFSRRQPLLPKKVNVSDLLFGMEDLLRRSITQDVEIEIKTSVTPSIMEVDAAQLESAILNLALNSRDAMPNGGTLRVETSQLIVSDDAQAIPDELQPGSYLSIAVSDDGEGMDENQIAHAFDPFFTTKEVGKGSGLGLSMVFGFVKQSGGHITIDSVQGKGTTIKMIFTCDFSAHEMQPLEGTTYG